MAWRKLYICSVGGLHGLGQVIEKKLKIHSCSTRNFEWIARVCVIFAFSAFAWIFFRAQNISEANYVITHMFSGISNPLLYIRGGLFSIGLDTKMVVFYAIMLILPLGVFDYLSLKGDVIEKVSCLNVCIRWLIYVAIVLFVLLISLLNFSETPNAFVYFQF